MIYCFNCFHYNLANGCFDELKKTSQFLALRSKELENCRLLIVFDLWHVPAERWWVFMSVYQWKFVDWLPSNNINIDTGQTLLLLLTLFQHTAPCQVSQVLTRQCNDPVREGDVSFEMVSSSGAYNLSWSSRILTNIWRRMSTSFSNSFDSEIVLLGGGQRPGKHSRVGAITSKDQEEEDQDLQIQDSVSVRTFSSISQMK